MTIKEALQSIIEDGIELGAGDYVDYEALVIAADALRKQIPQNPRKVVRVWSDGHIRYNDYYCPSCSKQQKCDYGKRRVENGWFCERCGQKLTWLEVE